MRGYLDFLELTPCDCPAAPFTHWIVGTPGMEYHIRIPEEAERLVVRLCAEGVDIRRAQAVRVRLLKSFDSDAERRRIQELWQTKALDLRREVAFPGLTTNSARTLAEFLFDQAARPMQVD